MKMEKVWDLIKRSSFVEIGFVDTNGMPLLQRQ